MKHYALVYLELMVLLALTLGLAYVDLKGFNTAVSLLVAGAKALLVVLFFMHVRSSPGLHRVFAAVGVFWLGILLFLSLTDYLSRNWLLLPGHWPS